MATVKIKLRLSKLPEAPGSIYYRVIHNRTARQIKTGYRVYPHEWNKTLADIVLPEICTDRQKQLAEVRDKIESDVRQLHRTIRLIELRRKSYTAAEVIFEYAASKARNSMLAFMEDVIAALRKLGKTRTAEAYATTLNSFCRFRNNNDISLDDVNAELMVSYEMFLRNSGITPNSSSFYMRNLRAVYNRAVDKELTRQRNPFKFVYTGVDKTVKRALPIKTVREIKQLRLDNKPSLRFARDMFLFSFYTRGMSFVDIAYLRKSDISNGILSYRRKKTGQQLFIRWEKCMQDIVDRYTTDDNRCCELLLPILDPMSPRELRNQYLYAAHNVNRSLRIIGGLLGLTAPLTMYVARHAWASIARSKNVPLSVISEGMGHDSEATTRIYLASLETADILDRANSRILRSL